jgi:hypothetical protein
LIGFSLDSFLRRASTGEATMKFRNAAVLLLLLAANAGASEPATKRLAGPMPHDVYVWQRAWTAPVLASIAEHATNFATLVPLAAEVTWKRGEPTLVRPELDHATLRSLGRPVGLALRIGPFAGPFAMDNDRARWLAETAAALLADTRSNGVGVAELQIDFDCAESKLDGYRLWVETIRRRVRPTPLILTALPAWLRRVEFQRLAAAADGYVLQVHSLDRPARFDAAFTLCDPTKARQAVERAAAVGVPFRVALPTYSYTVAFDRDGKFLALAAEGPAMSWPEGVRLREVGVDAPAMAALIMEWNRNRPVSMHGVIWYRLPVEGERLNWRWPTLASAMTGTAPEACVRATLRYPAPGLVEVAVENHGAAAVSKPMELWLRWKEGAVVAADGLSGFEVIERGGNELSLRASYLRLDAGARRAVGWVRFDQEAQVQLEIQKQAP